MVESPNVRLSLPSRSENVLVVRQALTGVAECLGLDAVEANDLNTAVTEAANNVVMHAYAASEGPLEVELYTLSDAIAVVVRDSGSGMPATGEQRERAHAGMGLAIIEALCRRVEFAQPPGGGTEVRMELATPKLAALEPIGGRGGPADRRASDELPGMVELGLAPNAIARAVLPRVLSTLAARAYFSTDRISDVQLVADVLAANAGDSIRGSHLEVGVTATPRKLELRVGPLLSGRGASLVVAANGFATAIERLTDATRVAAAVADPASEMLELRLVDQR